MTRLFLKTGSLPPSWMGPFKTPVVKNLPTADSDFPQLKPEPSDYWVSLPDARAEECGSLKHNKLRSSNLFSFLRSRPIFSVLC